MNAKISAVSLMLFVAFLPCAPATAGFGRWEVAAPQAELAGAARTGELLYVADGSGPVAAYPTGSRGAVAPSLVIADPNLPNTVWNPWGVAFDAAGNLYVQSFLSNATSFVFGPGAHGHSLPIRVFAGGGPDSRSIAVDSDGYEYVATSEAGIQILVMPPRANGQPGNSYFVPPLRTIFTDETAFNPWPSLLSVDRYDNVIAAIVRDQGNAIEVFSGGPTGGDKPIRIVSGSRTGLGKCNNPCDNLAVTYSRYTDRVYVAVSAGAHTHLSVFSANANGNIAPLRVISGPNTGLSGSVITGIADSQRNGEIYAMVKRGQFDRGQINVYASLANGDVKPERSFVDSHSGFVNAYGIAITR